MEIYQESTFTGQLLKADAQDKEPIEIKGNVLFCSNGEVLLRTNQHLYDSIQSKMLFESSPVYGAKTNGISAEEAINNPSLIERGSIIRPAYEGKYKVQGEIKTDRNFRIKAIVSRDTGLKPDMLLQEAYLEYDESLASKEVSVTTVYGLVAFDPPYSIEMSLPKRGDALKIEKIISEKKILEANISSKLSILSRELSVEAQEKIAYFLIFMISFASGRKVIEAYQRSEVKSAEKFKIDEYWRGSRSRAVAKGFRVIQEPHLKLFLEQLISKEDELELYRESLLLSLSWYLETFESNILATNFVLLCTVIEAFNEEFKKIQQSSTNRLISKSKYKAVRKSIFQCVDEHESDLHGDDNHEKYAIFKAKIESVFNSGSLNMIGNLSANLQEMLKYFKVKHDDLFPEFDFIKIRNNVIHRGTHDFDEIFDVYLRLESLYIRLILCVLEYNGDYMEHNGTGLICRTVPFV